MKVQLKPGEPVKFKGKIVVGTEKKPAVLVGDEEHLTPLIDAGIATEVEEASSKQPTKTSEKETPVEKSAKKAPAEKPAQ